MKMMLQLLMMVLLLRSILLILLMILGELNEYNMELTSDDNPYKI